jgi:beta-mannanase
MGENEKPFDLVTALRERCSDEQLKVIVAKGKRAEEWTNQPYTQMIFEKLTPMIAEFDDRKASLPLKSFKIEANGEQLYWNLLCDEQYVEAYRELIAGVKKDINFGVAANKALTIVKVI